MRERRRSPSRSLGRRRPRIVKELLRIGVGPSMLYLVAGTNRAVKIKREDVRRLEDETRRMVEEMLEGELNDAMERLGIQTLALTDDEKQIVMLASKYVLAGYFLLTNGNPP